MGRPLPVIRPLEFFAERTNRPGLPGPVSFSLMDKRKPMAKPIPKKGLDAVKSPPLTDEEMALTVGTPEFNAMMRQKSLDRCVGWPVRDTRSWEELLDGRRFDEPGMEVRFK